eukprot:1169909-Pyramimonas_sp.AAC.1
MVNTSDGEPGTARAEQKAADAAPGPEATPQDAPPRGHPSNGEIEAAARETKNEEADAGH